MSIIKTIRQKREPLAIVLEEELDIPELFGEHLYANVAHFIFELLQNAEDARASKVTFDLSSNELIFKHNGRPFEEADIWSITSIGKSSKAEDENKIGRFGIGFKSVFSYTETPYIWSPTYSFKISKLVLPWELPMDLTLGDCTRFKIPFNSRKKRRHQAFLEIRNELERLSDNTLLFLSHITKIQWRITDGKGGCLIRSMHSDQHMEICRETDGGSKKSSHFLRFTEPANGFESQYIAVAFELGPLSSNIPSNMRSSLAEQFRIVSTKRGCIAVYFEAQESNLRFHLHAPFDPKLDRAGIKDTPLNERLFQQLAGLTARSLHTILDLELLDRSFLAVLPNSRDNISARCEPIREAIVDAMKEQPLTPKHIGGHAPASQLLQAETGLKNLLDHDDLCFLLNEHEDTFDWAITADNNTDLFLQDLEIEKWDSRKFVRILNRNLSKTWGLDELFIDWLHKKSNEWHYQLYNFLQRHSKDELYWLEDICIVRCSDGKYRSGGECYFPTSEIQDDPIHPRVVKGTFTSNKNKDKRGKSIAREFLESIGVREIGKLQQIEAILKQRYTDSSHASCWKNYDSDLRLFIELVEENEGSNEIFQNYFIFQCADQSWSRPGGVYLDVPYQRTDLESYYSRLGSKSKRVGLSNNYQNFDMREQFIKFARVCGVADRLEIKEISCENNPKKEYLYSADGVHFTSTGINSDFFIPDLEDLLESPTLQLSRLIWNTLCNQLDDRNVWEARYRKNASSKDLRRAESQLVHQLSMSKWVPQKASASSQIDESLAFVRPALASAELLPLLEEGFPFNPSWPWLEKIDFGTETERHLGISKMAKEYGFSSEDQLERAMKLARQIDRSPLRIQQEIEQLLAEQENPIDLPQHNSIDQERRSKQVREKARQVPEHTREKRLRTILLDHSEVKEESKHYLRHRYTNLDHVTICQICEKSLPFKRPDGHYFFVAVPFLPNLGKDHYQNYLALCPNHAAMFMYANDSEKELKDKLLTLSDDDRRLEIVLAGESTTIYFNDLHLCDLKAIID